MIPCLLAGDRQIGKMVENITLYDQIEKDAEGTSAAYVFALIVPNLLTMLLTFLLNLHSRVPGTVSRFLTEFIVLFYTIVFNVTILSDFILEVLCLLVLLTVPLVLINLHKCALAHDTQCGSSGHDDRLLDCKGTFRGIHSITSNLEIPAQQPGYVTVIRSMIFLVTAVCILAVDFKIFPGYSFKTETCGCSLMDVGIGLFVCSTAIVAKKPPAGYFRSRRNLFRLFVGISPYIVLGVGRALVIEQLDYHQGVTEYGKNWNAFLTLGATKLFATLLAGTVPREQHLVYVAVLILGLHEAGLQYKVAGYVMSPTIPRDNFLAANREGIASIPGFVGLYLSVMYIGTLIRSASKTITAKELLRKASVFALMSASLWPMCLQVKAMFAISRRICNLGYVVWILAILVSLIVFSMLIELFCTILCHCKAKDRSESYVPLIMRSINYNGLFFFLLANVLTGMVNMTIATSKSDTLHSLWILMIYMLINCLVVTILYKIQIKIKFW